MVSSRSIRRTVPDLQRELPIQDEHETRVYSSCKTSRYKLMFKAFSRAEIYAWIKHFLHIVELKDCTPAVGWSRVGMIGTTKWGNRSTGL